MTDRELLEAAARAAGLEIEGWFGNYAIVEGANWHPLSDDGDALRLAVKLGICVSHHGATHVCETSAGKYLSDESDPVGDGLAATRRAIVRAAAAVGQGKA